MATSSEKNKIIKLSQAEYTTLSTTGTLTKDGVTYTYSPTDTIYVTPDAISGLSEYKEQLRLICNRYLDSTDRLPIDCTWEELIAVFNEYDEYSYMNAFLNSIEVFPDKDYSINDTEGHIKGLNDYAFHYNSALKSIFLASCGFDTNKVEFRYCTNLERLILGGTVYYGGGTVGVDNLRYNTSLKHCSFPKAGGVLNDYWGANTYRYSTALVSLLFGGSIQIQASGNNWIPANASFSALILTSSAAESTITGSNGATAIINSGGYVYVPSALLSNYQTATNWVTVHQAHTDSGGNYNGIQDIESNLSDLRTLGVDFSLTPYANYTDNMVYDATIGEVE